jgi:hypothetical protein
LNDFGANVIGNPDQIQHGQYIHAVSEFGVGLTVINAMIGREINNQFRSRLRKYGSRARVVGDVKILACEWKHIVTGKSIREVSPQLSVGSEYADAHDEMIRA